MTFSKIANTRAIGPAHRVTAIASYAPRADSTRRTDLSWQALKETLEANPEGITVQQYLDAQRLTNPENIGDALPCFRYWCGSAKVAITEPVLPPAPEPEADEPKDDKKSK